MTGDIDDVVNPAHDPEVSVRIASGTVTGKVNAFDVAPVLLPETLRISIDGAHHRRPGTLHDEEAAFVNPDRFSGAVHDFRNNSRKGSRCRSRLGGNGAGNG